MASDELKRLLNNATITIVEVHLGYWHDEQLWVAECQKSRGIGWKIIAKRKNKEKLLTAIDRWFESIPCQSDGMNILKLTELLPFNTTI